MGNLFSREASLTEKFKNKFNAILDKGKKENYSQMPLADLLALKNELREINNIVTVRVTIAFVDFLEKENIISRSDAERIKEIVNKTNANENGFDLEDEECHILAEVKCNNPTNEGKLLGQQKRGIQNDLAGLQNGKIKRKNIDTKDYYRFMVLLDNEKPSIQNAIKELLNDKDECILYSPGVPISKGNTYIVFIPSSQVK